VSVPMVRHPLEKGIGNRPDLCLPHKVYPDEKTATGLFWKRRLRLIGQCAAAYSPGGTCACCLAAVSRRGMGLQRSFTPSAGAD
jgi:hypothetical protein